MDSPREGQNDYFLQPGYIFVSKEPYIISTILGSCVSVCLRDRVKKYGGMNHYIYARPVDDQDKPIYGSVSITYMIKTMQEFGSKLNSIDAYIIGGARSNTLASSTVGPDNIRIAKEILNKFNLNIRKIEVSGQKGKKVIFNTFNGELRIKKLDSNRKD
ncbi:MAG: chemotaxis protein CheD [Halanaerobiales bacterium]